MPSFTSSFWNPREQKRCSAWLPQAGSCSASWHTPSFFRYVFPCCWLCCRAPSPRSSSKGFFVSQASWLLHPLQSQSQAAPTDIHNGPVPDPQRCVALLSVSQQTHASSPYLIFWLHENESLMTQSTSCLMCKGRSCFSSRVSHTLRFSELSTGKHGIHTRSRHPLWVLLEIALVWVWK